MSSTITPNYSICNELPRHGAALVNWLQTGSGEYTKRVAQRGLCATNCVFGTGSGLLEVIAPRIVDTLPQYYVTFAE